MVQLRLCRSANQMLRARLNLLDDAGGIYNVGGEVVSDFTGKWPDCD